MKETFDKFCSLPSTTQKTTSEKTEEEMFRVQKLFDSNYYRSDFIEFIRPHRLDRVFELIMNYISFIHSYFNKLPYTFLHSTPSFRSHLLHQPFLPNTFAICVPSPNYSGCWTKSVLKLLFSKTRISTSQMPRNYSEFILIFLLSLILYTMFLKSYNHVHRGVW